MSPTPPLKIVLLLDGNKIPRWVHQIIYLIENSDYAEIFDVIISSKSPCVDNDFQFKGLSLLIYRFHEFIDRITYFNNKILSDKINAGELIDKYSVDKPPSAYDVVLNFSSQKASDEIYHMTKFGIWQLLENFKSKSSLLHGYWQSTQRHPEIVTALWQQGFGKSVDKLLYISSQITDYHAINRSRNKFYKRAILITMRMLRNVHMGGNSYLKEIIKVQKEKEKSFFQGNQIVFSTNNVLNNLGTHLKTLLTSLYQNLFFLDHWFVLIKNKNSEHEVSTDFSEFTKLVSPKDRFWADPFVESRGGYHYVFVEELMYKTSRGRLSVVKLDAEGVIIESKPILETPYHLSYPYIFQHGGEDYMIPEMRENGKVDLYKCTNFPYEWEFVKTLMDDIQAVDVTPFYYQNKWWIFCNVDEGDGNSSINDEMFLFYCTDLFNDTWISHPMNPVISDVKRARSAGKIIVKEGKIYRPSQDCSTYYGHALNMNEITKLTETEYEESLLEKHLPDWKPELKRIHTYNSSPNLAVIDSFYFRRK